MHPAPAIFGHIVDLRFFCQLTWIQKQAGNFKYTDMQTPEPDAMNKTEGKELDAVPVRHQFARGFVASRKSSSDRR